MKLKKLLLLLVLLSTLHFVIVAQVNTDSIFQIAINQSRNNQYDSAIENAKKAINSDSKRADIHVFVANIYSWKNQNDTALVYIQNALKLNYLHDDLYESWTNILLRLHDYDDLLKVCDEAERNHYSNSEDLLRKRMIAYSELKLYDKGISLIKSPDNQKFLDIKQFNDLYTSLLLKRNSKLLSAFYILDLFNGGNNTQPQQLASIGYSFPVGANNLGFRVNYANRFGLNGVQLESDFYLKLKKKQYMYFNYGYGFNSKLFPTHRFGFEYYFPLPSKFEASMGGRYLNYPGSEVLIATGHIGKYFGNSWIGLRPYYVYAFKTPTNTESFSLIGNYRLFGKNELEYWGMELGIGNSPDEVYTTSQTVGFNQLTAYKIKLEKNFILNRVSDFHIGLGYSREEFSLNQFRNRFTVELGYKLRLK